MPFVFERARAATLRSSGNMIVLGIETSCDDTSLALYSEARGVIANLTANQIAHEQYGGIVPEIASRAHIRNVLPVFAALLEQSDLCADDIEGIGVSNGPGLIGSLLVGVGFAKALAFALNRPLVGVHHIEAHILSNELLGDPIHVPAIVLVVSGGHTSLYHIEAVGRYELLGGTRDDAAGEAFDKIAKLLGLGFPGGPEIERVAQGGDPHAVSLPRPMQQRGNFEFSFSGLKTAVRLHVERLPRQSRRDSHLDAQAVADVAASAQEAIVDVLVSKVIDCAVRRGVAHVYLAGGVAANGRLRGRLRSSCECEGLTCHAPLLEYCTDNGAMVARAAWCHLLAGRNETLDLDVFARGPVLSWA